MSEMDEALPYFIKSLDSATPEAIAMMCAARQAHLIDLAEGKEKLTTGQYNGQVIAHITVLFAVMERHFRDHLK